ncbi:MAG: NUDIX domain-containing protein [Stackebrandtia sp.]
MVTAIIDGCRRLLMIQHVDGRGCALHGGCVEPGKDSATAAIRELEE